jgi:twitching motility protein PilI
MLNDYFFVQLRQSLKVALPLDSTREVISLTYGEICPVPGVSPALLGVANQRGKLLWVLELGDLLKIPSSEKTIRPQDNLTLLVLNDSHNLSENQSRQVGCVVSTLKGVIALDSAEFQPVSSHISPALKAFSSAIALIEQEAISVIDVQAILNTIQTEISSNLVNSL